MAFWTYLLRCGDGSFYVGHTDALEARIGAHRQGRGCDHTARRQPVTFAWAQDFPTRLEALEAERRIKGWSRAKKEALIASDWTRLSQLAKAHGTGASTSSARTEEVGAIPFVQPTSCVSPQCAEGPYPTHVRPEPVEGRVADTPA